VRHPHFEHNVEDRVPRVRRFEHRIGEHAPVPADVLDTTCLGVLEPVARAADDIELAVGIVGRAVLARLVVIAGTVHLAVVLRHVEVDRPWPQLVDHPSE